IISLFWASVTSAPSSLSLHGALPILRRLRRVPMALACGTLRALSPTILAHEDLSHARSPEDPQYWHIGTHRLRKDDADRTNPLRSEEHTSELQSRENLGCRLLLEKKK